MSQNQLTKNSRYPLGWDRCVDWHDYLENEFSAEYFQQLQDFLSNERRSYSVFPMPENVFRAFQLSPFRDTKFVILGQDPYPGAGQAHGLSFSVPRGVKIPPSLANIFRELSTDIGCQIPESGNLEAWARQGGLLLNAVLTVRAGEANSHAGQGWELFTDTVIGKISELRSHAVFVLWGRSAQRKKSLIDPARHTIVESAHPSPLAAHRGFFGSRPFSAINKALTAHGQMPIDWRLNKAT